MVPHANIDQGKSLVVSERGLPSPDDAPGAVFDSIPCCLVEEVPRQPPGTPAERIPVDPWLLRRRAALVGSYLAGDSVLVSWSRARWGGPVQVLVGGSSLTSAPASEDVREASRPPGASGRGPGAADLSRGASGRGPGAADLSLGASGRGPCAANLSRGASGGGPGAADLSRGASGGGPGAADLSLGASGRGPCAANLPPGVLGVEFRGLRALLEQVPHWVPVAGRLGPIRRTDAGDERRILHAARLEEVISTVWPGPFSWLVWATPVRDAEIERLAAALERLPSFARAQASANSASATLAERMEARHRELEHSRLDGLWDIRVLVGHDSPEPARRLAALLCSVVDVEQLPYALHPLSPACDLHAALDLGAAAAPVPDQAADHVDGSMWPIVAGTDLLAALAFTPRTELPGLRLRVPSTFDLTPESAGELTLGTILSPTRAEVGPLTVSRDTLTRHTFVCGATGSGKSQTIRGLLERFSRADPAVPWLVIEPAKAEYRLMAGRLRDTPHEVVCIRPGATDSVPVGLNPLEPEPGFPLQTHLDLIRALFLASFRSEEPFPQVLTRALTRCYEEQGFDLVLGESAVAGVQPRYPQLADLQRVAREVVTSIGYGPEVTQDVRGFIDVRLSSLRLGTAGRFLGDGHPLDVAGLLARNVVLELEDVGDDQEKAFLMGLAIVRVYEHLRTRAASEPPGEGELRHVLVVEEAHRLLRRPEGLGQVAHAVELFANLLAEVRAYGQGIVVAEQIPEKIIPDVIKNTAVKVIHRLPARDDRDAVGATMNLTDAQSEYIVGLRTGEAAAFSDAMDYPVLVRMECGSARESDQSLGDELPLAGRMSVACGACCQEQPCSLRDVRRAQRLLERDPRVTLWVELVVVAHLLGEEAPVAGGALLNDCRRLSQRERECAIAHAVQRAVASRSSVIARHFSPDALAVRAAAVVNAQLDRSPLEDDRPPADWSTAFARAESEQVLFGRDTPSALESAVGVPRTDERWARALADRVRQFAAHPYGWPAARFAVAHVAGDSGGSGAAGGPGAVGDVGLAASGSAVQSAGPAARGSAVKSVGLAASGSAVQSAGPAKGTSPEGSR